MEQSYFKARTTLIEMMTDRGYLHEKGLDVLYTNLPEFRELFNSDQMDLTGIQTPSGLPVYVRVLNNKTDIKDKRQLFDRNNPTNSPLYPVAAYYNLPLDNAGDLAKLYDSVHVILVYRAVNKDLKYDSTLESQFLEDPNVEVFPVQKLTYNVTKHVLVPKHELLSEEDRSKVLQKYNASRQMLTKICLDDPVNRYYNGKVGDVYRIEQAGFKPAYRTVIPRTLPKRK